MATYKGTRLSDGSCVVICRDSSGGFTRLPGELDWGHNGDSALNLARQILAREGIVNEDSAQEFKRNQISWLPEHKWTLTSESVKGILGL